MSGSPVSRDPEISGGRLCFAGTRVPVDALVPYIAAGRTLDEWMLDYPSVPREQAVATLKLALRLLETGDRGQLGGPPDDRIADWEAEVDAMYGDMETPAFAEAALRILDEPMRVPVPEHLRRSGLWVITWQSQERPWSCVLAVCGSLEEAQETGARGAGRELEWSHKPESPGEALPHRLELWWAEIDDWIDAPGDEPESIRLYISIPLDPVP